MDTVIRHAGREYGTAAEIAHRLGGDVTIAMVRNWARVDGLPKVRMADAHGRPEVRYPVDQAATIERDKRISGKGRARRLDSTLASIGSY